MPNDVWRFLRDPNEQAKYANALTDVVNRGLVAGTFGAPVDLATQAANLLVAGAGYTGHKLGLLSQPPDLIDPASVPGSSEWIGRKMQSAGLLGDYRNPIAELGAAMLSPVAMKGAVKAGGLLAQAELAGAANAGKVGPISAQRGAVYVGKQKVADNAYHGTAEDFSRFSRDKVGAQNADFGDAFWLTDDYGHARGYAAQASGSKTGNVVKEANVYFKNPMTVDAMHEANLVADDIGIPRPSSWDEASELLGYNDWAKNVIQAARAKGHDGVIIKNTGDAPGTAGGLADHFAVFNEGCVRFKR